MISSPPIIVSQKMWSTSSLPLAFASCFFKEENNTMAIALSFSFAEKEKQ
jgi:hypothetical protein